MPDLLRVGLAGCGYQGHCLATALGRTTTFSLVACADPDQEAAATVAALSPRTRPFSSVEALLEATSLDALLVATPHHLLRPVSLAALRAGKHVLAEKPCGLDEQEAAAVQQEARRADVRYMAGYSCRFSLGRHVHDLLAAGAVGDIQAITGTMGCGPLNEGWAATAETGGGPCSFWGRTWSTWSCGSWTMNRSALPAASGGGRAQTSTKPRLSKSISPADRWPSAWSPRRHRRSSSPLTSTAGLGALSCAGRAGRSSRSRYRARWTPPFPSRW